jgi:hypothetical protein
MFNPTGEPIRAEVTIGMASESCPDANYTARTDANGNAVNVKDADYLGEWTERYKAIVEKDGVTSLSGTTLKNQLTSLINL